MNPHISIPAMEAPFTRKTSQRYAGFHGKPPISSRSHWQESPRGDSAIAEPHKGSAGYVGFSGNRPAALPHMKPGSAIITTSSVNAYNPDKTIIDYAATKGAIMIFTKGLAKQLAQKGIRVNSVAPGPIWTPLQPSGGQFPDKLPEFGADTPMGRPGQPAELAPIYVLLATNEDSYSTGQVYGAVGGNGGP
jgi:Enoyl-(Acyl carrier protein) reductase